MQSIMIVWPILVCAFLTGMLLAWVLFVSLPRMRHTDVKRPGRRTLRAP